MAIRLGGLDGERSAVDAARAKLGPASCAPHGRRAGQPRHVVLAGGTGFIGSALRQALEARGDRVTIISRWPGRQTLTWGEVAANGLPEADAVVHLAGAHIMRREEPWRRYCETVLASRVETTGILVAAMAAGPAPEVFVSTVGKCLYGQQAESVVADEATPSLGSDFPSRLSRAWSAAAAGVPAAIRHVELRLGIVLAEREDGARTYGFERGVLPVFRTLFARYGAVAFGDGRQGLPWVHIDDVVAGYVAAIDRRGLSGGYNLVAPTPTTNMDFVRCLAARLGVPLRGRIPAWIVQAAVGAERVGILTRGQLIRPRRSLEAGLGFRFPTIEAAIADLVPAPAGRALTTCHVAPVPGVP